MAGSMSYWLELLCQPAMYPIYLALIVVTVLTWVVTTPIRNVGWSCAACVCELCAKHARLTMLIVEGYLAVAKDEDLWNRPKGEYLWLMYEAVFEVPLKTIEARRSELGLYGVLAYKGWDFAHEYWCVYLPDTSQSLWNSACQYSRGSLRACVCSFRRAQGIAEGLFWFIALVVAVVVYVPLTVLRILEVLLNGWRGVLIVLLVLNVTNWIWDWGAWVYYVTAVGIIIFTALIVLEELQMDKELEKVSPARVARIGWFQVRKEAAKRRRSERAALQDLNVEELVFDGPPESPPEPQPETVIQCERSPAAIQAELRQSQSRVEQLQVEFDSNSEVRRGRRDESRGECPEPRSAGCTTGDASRPFQA